MQNKLIQTQAQKMALTVNMQQSLQILQCSNIELIELVNKQLDENPVLESDCEPAVNYWGTDQAGNAGFSSDYDPIAAAEDKSGSLEQHLLLQLNCLGQVSAEVYEVSRYIIGNLDPNGYLALSLERVAADLRISTGIAEQALSLVQEFDPAGVGARNLRECLLIQLIDSQPENRLVYPLVDRYLEDIAANRLTMISKELKVTVADIQEAASLLTQLVPRPGMIFQKEEPRYIIPDLTIEQGSGDRYRVHVNRALSASLSINRHYLRLSEAAAVRGSDQQFLKEQISSAQWLMKCLSQRERTLQLVTEAIVDVQSDFFREGRGHLAPLTLKEVADRVGMHESTISRSVTGKYAQTPQGLFELKYFFASGVQASEGVFTSAENVKETIKKLIQHENRAKPYSDQELMETINETGIHISRRTVAKYREEIGIAKSSKRVVR
jgi:RNA polymerase sigma-54 factor